MLVAVPKKAVPKKAVPKKAVPKKAVPKKAVPKKAAPELPSGGELVTLSCLEERADGSWIKAHLSSCHHWNRDESVMLYSGDLEVAGDLVLDHRRYKTKPAKTLGHVVVLGDLRVGGSILNLEADYGIGLFVAGKLEATHAIFGGSVGFINSSIRLQGYGMSFNNHGFVACSKRVSAKGLVHHDNHFPGKPTARTRQAEWGAKGELDAAKVLVESLVEDEYPMHDLIIAAILEGQEVFRPRAELARAAKAAEAAKALTAAKAARRKTQTKTTKRAGPFGSLHLEFVDGVGNTAYIAAKDGGVYQLALNKDPKLLYQATKNPDVFSVTEKGLFLIAGKTLHRSDKNGRRWVISTLPEWKFVDVTIYGTIFVLTPDEALLVSTDGGKHFTVAKVPDKYGLYSIVATSPRTLFAAGHWVILRSGDGGLSWKVSKRGGGSAGVYCEAFAFNEKEILATGQWQSCALTIDGGKTWKAHRHDKSLGRIHSLTHHRDGRLFGVTGEKKPSLVVSKNLGRTWAPTKENPRGVNWIWSRPDGALLLVGKKGYFEIRSDL